MPDLIEQLDALLPQTQCQRCTYPTCRDYAIAMAQTQAAPNLCPPGGAATVQRLAEQLGRPPLPLTEPAPDRQVARIDADNCIGCTLCQKPCPTDCIIGTSKAIHRVLREDCTGCGLCIPTCPTDCIHMQTVPPDAGANPWPGISPATAAHWQRLAKRRRVRQPRPDAPPKPRPRKALKQEIEAALARKGYQPDVG